MGSARVLLVDSHRLARDGVKWCLAGTAFEVADEAACFDEAYERSKGVDVVIAEIGRAELGKQSLRAAISSLAPARTLVFSWQANTSVLSTVKSAGARGCLSKKCSPEQLLEALKAIAAGRRHFPEKAQIRKDASHIELSCREVEIARHVASGRPSRAIATSLGLGVRTVESHRRTIKRKLGVASNAELVRYAIENLPGL
jgi:DNA-binding NarL/FixJ family response regulator